VPLSRVSPRQVRYLRLIPSILLYLAYLTILSTTRGAIENGSLPPAIGLWWVHGLFLAVGIMLVAQLHHKLPWLRKAGG